MIHSYIAALALVVTSPAVAQPAQVLPQMGVDRSGACRALTVRDVVVNTMSAMGCLDARGRFAPAPTVLDTQFNFPLIGTDSPLPQRAARLMPATSAGVHVGNTRYAAAISMAADGSGIAAGPDSADYGLGVSAYRNGWLTSSQPGEMDAITAFGRNGIGDMGGFLFNVGTRVGATVGYEGVASIFNGAGTQLKAIRAQSAILDTISNAQFGAVIRAEVGTNLTAAIHIDDNTATSSNWRTAIELYTGFAGGEAFSIDGQGALMIGKPAARTVVLDWNSKADAYSRFKATAAGIGFFGVAPVPARIVLPAALPTDGTATNAQLAAGYNALRALAIAYGLAL